MTEDETITALTQCLRGNSISTCEKCPLSKVDFFKCRLKLRNEVIAMLKAQTPVIPIRFYNDENKCRDHYRCPYCDDDLTYEQKYCAGCGRAVKWE